MVKNTTQKITPFLWFDANAEEATNFTLLSLKIPRLLVSVAMEKERLDRRVQS